MCWCILRRIGLGMRGDEWWGLAVVVVVVVVVLGGVEDDSFALISKVRVVMFQLGLALRE
jgi:hypothetical protein